jgi:hypothetical protein
MSESQRKTYRPWEPQRYRQEAQSPDAKLPEGDVVFFLLDLVPQLDLRRFYAPYEEEAANVVHCINGFMQFARLCRVDHRQSRW